MDFEPWIHTMVLWVTLGGCQAPTEAPSPSITPLCNWEQERKYKMGSWVEIRIERNHSPSRAKLKTQIGDSN